MSTSAAARRLGVSPATMRRLINRGTIPCKVSPTGRIQVITAALDAYVDAMPDYKAGSLKAPPLPAGRRVSR
jgi:predicted site-specific integrase-resolvase